MLRIQPGRKRYCRELLNIYLERKSPQKGEKLSFTGINKRDVYNITAPFLSLGETFIAGRVEERDSEDSVVMFFRKDGEKWVADDKKDQFRLQDPFITKIDRELVFGGVEIFNKGSKKGNLGWRTLFFRGKSIYDLKQFSVGPEGMKDIRLVQLLDGRIGVFTRPQGNPGGRGTIGYITIDRLEELTAEKIKGADLLENQFYSDEWGGVNEVHLLKNGLLAVLGHIACFDTKGKRHYYPIAFSFDPVRKIATDLEILAVRSDFPIGPAKREDLFDVLFSGGIVRLSEGKAVLYLGISDTEAGKILIPDPFLKYE